MPKSEEELKSLLMKVKEESEKAGLKLKIKKKTNQTNKQKKKTNNEDHGIGFHHFMASRWGKQWKQWQTAFSWSPKPLQMVTAAMKLKDACSLEEKLWHT